LIVFIEVIQLSRTACVPSFDENISCALQRRFEGVISWITSLQYALEAYLAFH
jgi:hypothetical protein